MPISKTIRDLKSVPDVTKVVCKSSPENGQVVFKITVKAHTAMKQELIEYYEVVFAELTCGAARFSRAYGEFYVFYVTVGTYRQISLL